VMGSTGITLDTRDAEEVVAELLIRRPGYVPLWRPGRTGADLALVQAFARYLQSILQRLNQSPEKNRLAFLDLMGIQLIPAQGSRVPVFFTLNDNANDVRMPAGTRVASPPPPGRNDQIIFETERATGLAAAKLQEVLSLWPGRDQYIDHSAAFAAGQSFQPFLMKDLKDTPHILYLAHDTLLSLAGKSTVNVTFELTTPSSEHLEILWEYWDGAVWREFLDMRPACDAIEAAKLDSTVGLTHTGRFLLKTDCAQTSKTTVNGVENFWIRGRLVQPLPPDPARVLPEVDSIKLATEIIRPFIKTLDVKASSSTDALEIFVKDEAGTPLPGLTVSIAPTPTDAQGETNILAADPMPQPSQSITVTAAGELEQSVTLNEAPSGSLDLRFSVKGLNADKAFSGPLPLDVSKPFFPFGLQPQPGDVFYFTNAELFSKPNADFQIYVQTAQAPHDELNATASGAPAFAAAIPPSIEQLRHSVSWEYWDGTEWSSVLDFTSTPNETQPGSSPNDFTGIGLVTLKVPVDMVSVKVNEQEALWMRVRLLSGGYGFARTVKFTGGEFKYVVSQPPVLGRFQFAYTWQKALAPAQQVLTYNDFHYLDRTEEATWPGNTFQPYQPVKDSTPALYFGFSKRLPVDLLAMYFNIVEVPGDTEGLALVWEYFDGGTWQSIKVEDETHNFRLPGMVSFIGQDDSEALARFDVPLFWLRARLKEDGPPGSPTVTGLFPNAAWTVQHQTVVNEPIGISTGQANQGFAFRQIPVLEGEQIEVREIAGLRANVEWRLLVKELFVDSDHAIAELEKLLANEVTQTEVQMGDLRLVRDRNKRVTEVWVLWKGQPHFLFSGPSDRHYVVERARGRLYFGDGVNGKVPPLRSAIQSRQYRTGGGLVGNVAAKSIAQLLGPIGGIESVSNPVAAEGGADAESPEAVAQRGPFTLRHRGRALTPRDYETLAKEASPSIAVARAVPCRNDAGQKLPGWVTLVIIPRTADPRPLPSFGLREDVRKFVGDRAPADLIAADHLYVTGPNYVAVDVTATIVPLDAAAAGAVESDARSALQTFLHPLRGGPEGQGWDPGRSVFVSDVANVLARLEGVDYVRELALFRNAILQDEQVEIPDGGVVAAGDIRLKLLEP